MTEIWINTNNKANSSRTIVAISNTGLKKYKNGIIKAISLRDIMYYNNKQVRIYRILAEHFIPKTEEDIALGRNQVDHITHNPSDMNVNDIRNLRWCTGKENHRYPEARSNKSKSHIGQRKGEHWKVINGKRVWY